MKAKDDTELPIDIQQRLNLMLLADFLDAPRKRLRFNMTTFEEKGECGTVRCACGYGPYAGVRMLKEERANAGGASYGNGWSIYAHRAFGATGGVFCWLFAGVWYRNDNTREGAAARIRYYLKHGLPARWMEMAGSTEPLPYHDITGNILPEYAHGAIV